MCGSSLQAGCQGRRQWQRSWQHGPPTAGGGCGCRGIVAEAALPWPAAAAAGRAGGYGVCERLRVSVRKCVCTCVCLCSMCVLCGKETFHAWCEVMALQGCAHPRGPQEHGCPPFCRLPAGQAGGCLVNGMMGLSSVAGAVRTRSWWVYARVRMLGVAFTDAGVTTRAFTDAGATTREQRARGRHGSRP